MLLLGCGAALLNAFVFMISRIDGTLWHPAGMHGGTAGLAAGLQSLQFALGLFPYSVLAAAAYLLWRRDSHPAIPWLNAAGLAFFSVSMIGISGGSPEFHLSIFIVIAAAAYYENTRLIVALALLFGVYHLAGYYFFPELVFGMQHYPVAMLAVHGLFLVLAAGTTIWQIASKLHIAKRLEEEKMRKEDDLLSLVEQLKTMSRVIRSTSMFVISSSNENASINQKMRYAFENVIGGLGDQSGSLDEMEYKLSRIDQAIQAGVRVSEVMKESATMMEQAVTVSHERVKRLQLQMINISKSIVSLTDTISMLRKLSDQALGMSDSNQHFAEQSRPLAPDASGAKEIKDLLAAISRQSDNCLVHAASSRESIMRSVADIQWFALNFDNMNVTIVQLLDFIREMNGTMLNITKDAYTVTSEMSRISSVIDDGMMSMEQLTEMSENQALSSKEVAAEIDRLNQLAFSLQSRFNA